MSPPGDQPTRTTGGQKAILLGIFLAAFLVRLSLNIVFQGLSSGPDLALGSDHFDYDQLARNLLSGNGYRAAPAALPTAFRPPGTPFVLAGIYALCGLHYEAVRIGFSLFGALTCVVLFFVARRFVTDRWARAAAAVLALDLGHAYYSMHLFSEVPWTLVMSLAVLTGLKSWETGRAGWAVLQGVLLGFAALIRPVALLYPFCQALLAGFVVLTGPDTFRAAVRRWAFVLVSPLLMLAVILPWSFRNLRVLGEFTLISTQGGPAFYGANNEFVLENRGLIGRWTSIPPGTQAVRAAGGEVARDRKAYELGHEFLCTHSRDIPRLVAWKFIRLLEPWPGTPNRAFNRAIALSYGPMIPFILIGLLVLLGRSRRAAAVPLYSCVMMIAVSTAILYGDHRFRISIEPVLVLFAIAGASWLAARTRPRETGSKETNG